MTDMARDVPGEKLTTVSYAGPPELRHELPQRDPEAARVEAREIVERAERIVERAAGAVVRLARPYPDHWDSVVEWMRGVTQRVRTRVDGPDAFAALAEARSASGEVERVAESVLVATAGVGGSLR